MLSSDPTPARQYDCQTCGACCATFDVWLMGDDRERFERAPKLVGLTRTYGPAGAGGDWRFLKRDETTGSCIALEGGLRNCRCTIYEHRPLLCREFEAGTEDCLEARRKHGIDPPTGNDL